MDLGAISNFLEFWFTSYPFPVSLLMIIIALFIFWLVKLKPEHDKKVEEREEARKEAEQERTAEFVRVMTHCEETSRNTISMYERALDNSTKAIENNTAALNLMSVELQNLRDVSKAHDASLDKIREKQGQINDNVLKTLTLMESKD